jgi:hypothetical protein
MPDRLTKDEIYSRFPNEWILLKDPDLGPADEVLGGTLVCHTKDRDELWREAMARRPGDFAVFYTGSVCDHPVVV